MSYEEKLQLLKSHDPENVLIRVLESGESAINNALLDGQLKKLKRKPIEEVEEPELDPGVDEFLVGLYREQSTLFGDRRKLSNSFHDCDTDGERRLVSQSIQAVQRRIEHLRAQIRAYKNTGIIPAADDKYPVPDDPIKLITLQASLRSSISRKVRECKEYSINEDKRLAAAEEKLRELKTHLDRVKKAIKDRDLQPG